jgi:hypothetical protein
VAAFRACAPHFLKTRIGHSAVRTTLSVTDPNANRRQPVIPCVAITIKSAFSFSAVNSISMAASLADPTVVRTCEPVSLSFPANSSSLASELLINSHVISFV